MHLYLTKFLRVFLNVLLLCEISRNEEINGDFTFKVTDSHIHVTLTPAEWKSIAGTNVISEGDITSVNVNSGRSPKYANTVSVWLNLHKFGKQLALNLQPNENLVDTHFVALSRRDNHSRVISNEIPSLNCYFQSKGPVYAALDVCDGLRGIIFVDTNECFIIHPLPKRYLKDSSNVPHVMIKKRLGQYNAIQTSLLNDKINYKARRRKRNVEKFHTEKQATDNSTGHRLQCGNTFVRKGDSDSNLNGRIKRNASPTTTLPTPPLNTEIFVETAVFVDKDLYAHMSSTFPQNTEKELIKFVLALINAVHLLYHDPSLGWVINFVLKRLEILHTDPSGLVRVHDVDKFLSSFCNWQHLENPYSDDDPLHWDHAVILTGLDLYVLSKNGKISNQVVGLAPVAGMCTATSSCTVNEGRHFESAYVVAHEIGHNLGMRHDGPSADNNCDPTSFIMSPTLGSGKITWSTCSKQYLQQFLQSKQSRCLFDKSTTSNILDHGSNGILPGERFDAQQQCKLKYGSTSHHSPTQLLEDICKDLQCARDNYIWTSHPALEGTICGTNKWCRSGRCIEKGLTVLEAGYAPHQVINGGWSGWSPYSECASSCLHGDNDGLNAGSIGIMVASRRCNNPRPENGGEMCAGNDQKYKTCTAQQCQRVGVITLRDFSNEICFRASEVDPELFGTGQQRTSADPEEACKVWCNKRKGGWKSRGWSYPDGTVCQLRKGKKSTFCIRGLCKEFTCVKSSIDVIYAHSDDYCAHANIIRDKRRESPTIPWRPASECFYNCITPGTGMRLVEKKQCPSCNATVNVQTCEHSQKCSSTKTVLEHATTVCNKFSQRVRRLSGLGMQLAATTDDPHRPCRLACQDDSVNHRFYLVNGEEGWFPFGTDCTRGDSSRKAFCVNGKCLEFGSENTPIYNFEYTLPLMERIKRQILQAKISHTYSDPTIYETLKDIVFYLKHGYYSNDRMGSKFSIDLQNPIHIKKTEFDRVHSY
ncbi:A disintegrin and metalloproteinase with thrombospondin motifs adt-1-like [Planococcus citri]|uniref:A disintegrin and metalloproteinase with thrombospondin motifs adt-1-like n=1 Tax=Planococcus citri TaxID=170843 RepID=UPI0031F8538B